MKYLQINVFHKSLRINKVHQSFIHTGSAGHFQELFVHLLRIDSSARHAGSHSRQLGDLFESLWTDRFNPGSVTRRDLATHPVSHIASLTISGMFSPPDQRTPELRAALGASDALIEEVTEANDLLITLPMYNFNVPSSLKAWIDQVSRIGHTFDFDGQSFTGLLHGRRAFVVVAYGAGGYASGEGFAAANFVEPYLKFLLGFLGFDAVQVFNVQATNTAQASVPALCEALRAEMHSALHHATTAVA